MSMGSYVVSMLLILILGLVVGWGGFFLLIFGIVFLIKKLSSNNSDKDKNIGEK